MTRLQGGISGIGRRHPHAYPGCYFATFEDSPCQGCMDPAHMIRQQDIRREWELANPRIPTAWIPPTELTGTDLNALLSDPRIIRPACRFHHRRADDGFLLYEPPESAREFAREYGLSLYLPAKSAAERESVAPTPPPVTP